MNLEANDAFWAMWNEQIAKVDAMIGAIGALEAMLRVVVMQSPDREHLITDITISAQSQPDAAVAQWMMESVERMHVKLQ